MNHWNRRDFLRFIGLSAGSLLLGGYLSGCGRTTKQITGDGRDDKPLRIGYLPITDAAPLLLAHARGYYEAAGLTVALRDEKTLPYQYVVAFAAR